MAQSPKGGLYGPPSKTDLGGCAILLSIHYIHWESQPNQPGLVHPKKDVLCSSIVHWQLAVTEYTVLRAMFQCVIKFCLLIQFILEDSIRLTSTTTNRRLHGTTEMETARRWTWGYCLLAILTGASRKE